MHLLRNFRKILGRSSACYLNTNPVPSAPPCHVLSSSKPPQQQYSCQVIQRRLYGEDRQTSVQQKIKALYFPNPLVVLKNKWLTFQIRKDIDPDFNLDEFTTGASYAVSELTHLMATRQYSAIKELVYGGNEGPVSILKDYTESLSDPDLVPEMHFKPDEVTVVHPRIVDVTKEEDSHLVTVDVAAVGFKIQDERRSLVLQLQIRFGQSYSKDDTSGWLLYNIIFIRLQGITRSFG